jgi:hypothetical protein
VPIDRSRFVPVRSARLWTVCATALIAAGSACTASRSGAEAPSDDAVATGAPVTIDTTAGADAIPSRVADGDAALVTVTELSAVASPLVGSVAEVRIGTDVPVSAAVTARSGDHVVATPRTAGVLVGHTIPMVGLRADRTYELEIDLFDESGVPVGEAATVSFDVAPLPEWIPDHAVTVDTDRTSPGYTIIETSPATTGDPDASDDEASDDEASDDGDDQVPALLLAYDDTGAIVWY